ncbi:MAG: hypothetical protein C4309_11295 [Chloroflexota bacterium]
MSPELARRIQRETGQNVFLCYQCVKCTSGCPLAAFFDLQPNQVMRALQLGQAELALNAKTPWLCASCLTCTTRCPQGLDVARIMDHLTMIAREAGIAPKVPEVALFNKAFLRQVDLWGRAYELGLIAELNLRTGQPFRDLPLGIEMLRKGKLRLLPSRGRPPKQARPVEPKPNQIAYYPGCSLHSTATAFDRSARAVCQALGLDLTVALAAEAGQLELNVMMPVMAYALLQSIQLLANAARVFREKCVEAALPCAACFNRFRTALYETRADPELKRRMEARIGIPFQDRVMVRSLLDVLVNRVGLEAIARQVKRPLAGLRIVSYYGCLLLRPPQITGAQHPENPQDLDRLMAARGASLSLTRADIVLELSRNLIERARAAGADLIAVACPLCHANLDERQAQMHLEMPLPALYFTQLVALALGLGDEATALHTNMIDPRPTLALYLGSS